MSIDLLTYMYDSIQTHTNTHTYIYTDTHASVKMLKSIKILVYLLLWIFTKIVSDYFVIYTYI